MALRKFKKMMVPLSILFIIAMAVPVVMQLVGYMSAKKQGGKQVIAEVEGNKIYEVDFIVELNNLNEQISQIDKMKAQQGIGKANIPEDVKKRYVMNYLVNKQLISAGAQDLKIKINNKEIDDEVKQQKAMLGESLSQNKGQKATESEIHQFFIAQLNSIGLANEQEYKEFLKENKIRQKVLEEVSNSYKISDQELQKYYDIYKYEEFKDQTFEQAKPAIHELVQKDYSELVINSYMEKQRAKTKIVFKNDEYKKLYEDSVKPIVEKDGYKFMTSTSDMRVLTATLTTPATYNDELKAKINESLKTDLDNLIAIGKEAKAKGLRASEQFVGIDELRDLGKKYYYYLVENYKPSDEDLKNVYNNSNGIYDIRHSVGGYVVGMYFEPSEEDRKAEEVKVKELIKKITPENFADEAKKISEDPVSGEKGGDLGWIDQNTNFVPEFLAAIKGAKKGQVIGPVESEYGFHIIYIQDVDAQNPERMLVSHILIMPKASEAAKEKAIKDLQALKKQIEENKVKWSDVIDQDKFKYPIKEVFKRVYGNSAIPGIGYNQKAMDMLFNSKLNEVLEYQSPDAYFLMTKNNEEPYKKRTFEEVKERIRIEQALKYADTTMDNIK